MTQKTYIVTGLTPVKHGKQRLGRDAELTLGEREASELLRLGIVATPAAHAAPNNPATTQADSQEEAGAGAPAPDNLIDRLVDAIALLDPTDADHWTKSGKPEIKALEAATGLNINAATRDEAFAAFKASRG